MVLNIPYIIWEIMCVLPQINRNPHIGSRSCYCHPNGVNGLFRNKIAVPTYFIRSFTESDDSIFIFKLLVASIYHFQHIDLKKTKGVELLGGNRIRMEWDPITWGIGSQSRCNSIIFHHFRLHSSTYNMVKDVMRSDNKVYLSKSTSLLI